MTTRERKALSDPELLTALRSLPPAPSQQMLDYMQHKPNCLKGRPTPGCPQCGCQLKRVKQGPNGMLNAEQFDAVKAGDFYCDGCPGNQARGTNYRYWWLHELGTYACSCGLDPLLTALRSLASPQHDKDQEDATRVDGQG